FQCRLKNPRVRLPWSAPRRSIFPASSSNCARSRRVLRRCSRRAISRRRSPRSVRTSPKSAASSTKHYRGARWSRSKSKSRRWASASITAANPVSIRALASLERGLTEIRDALRVLTPAENLVGFEEAVKALSQKVDLIIAKDDPSALQQLETAIGGLRGVVSHVASNDTLARVAEEVRTLAGQVDVLANTAATGHAVSALEQRIDTLAAALTSS